ncbi:SWI/SNF-related matrix-associated actin-dependent regulator of chromatin subfamily A-like protein 1 isoform X2 [Cydia pomonella]|uniref:SWI/SNF-related matrix-associated actin-dependent regulator of chromatin subfamily A-like protein 1 isoform X2 n=1 Tax=Cydia pomonella TaxID=82600 RepID=UPI002ADE455F|nr:SWI/SNF-related matrix-associated actin-dependent regulator of chromatin subfamily A-like protein 1 isoform X2 [Cydia pomonella]
MACTKEEIERKRLAALQKRQNKAQDQNKSFVSSPSPISTPSPRTPLRQPWAGPVRNSGNFANGNRSFHPYAKPESSGSETSVPVTKVVSGTVYLISEDRFEVNPSEFCPPLINVFKTIPSKSYDPSSKLWNFSINDYQELMSKVAPLAPHIVLGALPQFVLKILQTQITDPRTLDLSPIESTLRNKLMPFQEDGVRFGIAHRGRCMIADDMGLGKTFQALAIASYYKHNFPLLIVTTSSMRETWQSKIHELLPTIPMMNIVTLSSNKDAQLVADRQTQVVIVSYKMVTIHKDLLRDKKFGIVIIDESHQVKTPNAKCTLALKSISKLSARMILLSGTPALSRPIELYTQLELIEPKLFNSYNEYGKRYCAAKQTNFGWDMTGQSNLAELQVILQKRFLIRRTKEEVLTELEQKTRESVILDETLLEFSKEDKTGLSQMAESYRSCRASERHTALLNFFSESSRVKIPAICKYIRQLLVSTKDKFLVFAHHRAVVDAICSTLDEEEVHYICITGSTPTNARADLVDKFQYVESCRCGVLSITAANSGLTLTAAKLVLFAELHWNPGILTQAESRAHRIGQRGGVCARYLLARGTCDDHMWPMLQGKLNVLNNVGLSGDSFEGTTTKHQCSRFSRCWYQHTKTSLPLQLPPAPAAGSTCPSAPPTG